MKSITHSKHDGAIFIHTSAIFKSMENCENTLEYFHDNRNIESETAITFHNNPKNKNSNQMCIQSIHTTMERIQNIASQFQSHSINKYIDNLSYISFQLNK